MENTQDSKITNNNLVQYNNNVKDADIILKQFKEPGNEHENVAVFILKYNLEQDGKTTPYEVVLGKIQLKKDTENLSSKARLVKEYLLKQLAENKSIKNSYKSCRELLDICKKDEIPYIFTEEGIEIITNDYTNTQTIEKTYRTQEHDSTIELICLNSDKKMDLYESELKIRRKINERIKEHKVIEAAIKEQPEEKVNMVLRAIKIKNLQNETNKEIILYNRRASIIDFLLYEYKEENTQDKGTEEHSISMEEYLKLKQYLKKQKSEKILPHSLVIGEEKEESNAEKYFRLKEKAIAIDVKKMLEDSQNEALEREMIENKKEKDIGEFNQRDNYINNCKTVFDFIKEGRDVNTQFVYSKKIGSFDQLYDIVDEQKDKTDEEGNKIYNSEEIMRYLKMKEEILTTIPLDKKRSFLDFELYSNHDSIKKFIKFVMNSEVRKDTREKEKDMLSDMFQLLVSEIKKNHEDDVEIYNTYAKRFDAEECSIPEEENKLNETPEDNENPNR